MLKKWKLLNSNLLLDSEWVKVKKNCVSLPNGITIDDFYSVSFKDAAAIVALDENNNIILKTEYRFTYDKELIEIPAGCFESGEKDGLEVAKRELLEETGYCSEEWLYLGETIESSSKLTNHMHIYMAKKCKKTGEQKLDSTEDLNVIVIPLEEAVKMVINNEICCNSSAHGILKTYYLLQNNQNNKYLDNLVR